MNLTSEAIKEFQEIAKDEYGIDLSPGEAAVIGTRLVLLYELIYRPLPGEPPSTQHPSAPHPDHA